MIKKVQALRGMHDLLPNRVAKIQQLEKILHRVAKLYHYHEIRTPILEETDLFCRSIGDETDIVAKEIYSFIDKGGMPICLRPEATASTVRAGIEHGLFYNQQQRLYYIGPMFRRERPQRGRYRQFHQFGVEAYGFSAPEIDAEIILLANRLWESIGIKNVNLELNTLGNPTVLKRYRSALISYLRNHADKLDADSQRRLECNPLRILDSKNPDMQTLLGNAPLLQDFLDSDAHARFSALCTILDTMQISYRVNPMLVRGLDYYTSTVFEWSSKQLGAQNAICGGGRYDGLVKQLGGHDIPAVGFSIGIERLIELMQFSDDTSTVRVDCILLALTDEANKAAVQLSELIRNEGMSCAFLDSSGSLRSKLKKADNSGASYALLLGQNEIDSASISLKNLRTRQPQQLLAQSDLIPRLQELISHD